MTALERVIVERMAKAISMARNSWRKSDAGFLPDESCASVGVIAAKIYEELKADGDLAQKVTRPIPL